METFEPVPTGRRSARALTAVHPAKTSRTASTPRRLLLLPRQGIVRAERRIIGYATGACPSSDWRLCSSVRTISLSFPNREPAFDSRHWLLPGSTPVGEVARRVRRPVANSRVVVQLELGQPPRRGGGSLRRTSNDPAGIRTRVCAVRGHRPDH